MGIEDIGTHWGNIRDLYWENGKNGNYYNILGVPLKGLYRGCTHWGSVGVILEEFKKKETIIL